MDKNAFNTKINYSWITALLLLFSVPIYSNSFSTSTTISGSTNVCEGDVITYTYPYTNGYNYNWSATGGTGIATINTNTNQATFTVTWGLAGNPPYSVGIQVYNGPNLVNSTSLSVMVNGNPNPQISSNFDSDCVDDTVKGEGHHQSFYNPNPRRGPSECETVCEHSPVTYTTNNVSGNSYQWTVIGDYTNISGGTTSSATVTWGDPGQAFVIVTETTPAGCTQTDTTCIEIVDKPVAEFSVDQGSNTTYSSNNAGSAPTIEICLNSTLCFDDLSVGGDTYYWDFGNGNSSTQQNPCETFSTAGGYNIMQIVENECHCADTSYLRVNVLQEEGPDIVCQNVVCNSGTFVYDAILPQPCSGGFYEWTISNNGTIINATGMVGTMNPQYVDGTDVTSIEVNWGSGPIGTIGLSISGCGSMCDQVVTVDIPIIPNTLDIEGEEVVCLGEIGDFKVPCFPGTTYRWYVDGILQSENENELSYQFNTTGTHTVRVDYDNSFLSCSGSSNTFQLEVLNPFEIDGPKEVCEGDAITINGPLGSTLSWEVKDQNGSVVASGGAGNNYTTPTSLNPGSYTVQAQDISSNPRDFCNDYAIHGFTVIPQPPAPIVINGPDEVCIGEVSIYTASPTSSNYYLEWVVDNAGNVITSNGNSVTVTWNSGVKSITLYHVSKQSNCKSNGYVFNVQDKTPPPISIAGPQTVCANTSSSSPIVYNTGALLDGYEWSIQPSNAGSVVGGQGTDEIEVIWNNYSGFADVVLTPIFCSSTLPDINYTVNVTSPTFTLSGPTTVCQNDNSIWNGSFNFGSGSNYEWEIIDALSGTQITDGTGSSINYDFPNNSGSVIIIMTADNCSLSHTETINVTVDPAPVANLTYSGQIGCIDQNSVDLLVSVQGTNTPYTYTWYHNGNIISGATGDNHSIGNSTSAAGSYYVVITGANNCSSTTNFVVADTCSSGTSCIDNGGTVSFTHNVSQTSPVPGCNQVTFNESFTGPNPSSYFWKFGSVGTANGSNPTFTFPASGVYRVTLIGSYNSPTNTCDQSYTYEVVVPVISDFEINISCAGGTFDVDLLNTSDVVHGPLSNFNHNWTVVDMGSSTTIASSTNQDFNNVSGLIEGNDYEITLIEDLTYSWNGQTINAYCEHTETFTMPESVDANFSFTTNIGSSLSCEGNPVSFTDNSVGDIASWDWDFGDGSGILTEDPNKTYTTPSSPSYTINLTVMDEYGCSDSYSDQITIEQNNLAGNISVSPTMPMCPGQSASLSYNDTSPQPSGPYSYLWSNNSSAPSISVNQTSTHSLAVTDIYGCFNSYGPATVEVVEIPDAIINGEDEYCIGDEISLVCNYGSDYSYEWFENLNNSSFINTGQTGTEFDRSNAPIGTHQYRVDLTKSGTNCVKQSLIFTVIVHPNPTVPFISTNPSPACPNNPVQLTVTNPGSFNSIAWSTGDVSTSTFANNSGVYYAVGTDVNGCSNFNSVDVYELPDFCGFMCGCYSDCIKAGGSYNFPGILGNYQSWRWERFDGINWNTVSSGSGAVSDYVTSTSGVHTIRLFVRTYNGCEGYSCETDLTLTKCAKPCEGRGIMKDIKCKVDDNGTVYYDFNMDISFGGFGDDCDKYSYNIITPSGSIVSQSPQFITPGSNIISGLWNTNVTYYPGGQVCFEIEIMNECDSTTCIMELCFEVDRCGDPDLPFNRSKSNNGDQSQSIDALEEVEFFPNPTNGMLNIVASNKGNYDVRIFNLSGQLVFQENLNFENASKIKIDLNHLGVGPYSIQCIGNNQVKTKSIIINR